MEYVSECAAHYFRERLADKGRAELEAQRDKLRDTLLGVAEEQADLETLPARQAALLRVDLERDAVMLRARLAAIESLLGGMGAGDA